MRKTKIVCTIGPSTDNDDVMRELMRSGMNVSISHTAITPCTRKDLSRSEE